MWDTRAKPVVMVDKLTGEVVEKYQSMYAAAKANNMYHARILTTCVKHRLTDWRYTFRLLEDYDPEEPFAEHQYGKPVIVITADGKIDFVANCRTEICNKYNVLSATLDKCIKRKRPLAKKYYFKECQYMGEAQEIIKRLEKK